MRNVRWINLKGDTYTDFAIILFFHGGGRTFVLINLYLIVAFNDLCV